MHKNRVFVNNYDCLTAAANSAERLFKSIVDGKSGISSNNTYFPNKCVGIGVVPANLDEALLKYIGKLLDESNLEDFKGTLLVIGSSVGGMKLSEDTFLNEGSYKNINPALHAIDSINYQISKEYKFKDNISFSTACTSSANAMGYAYEVISKGIHENVLVVGYDTLCKTTVGGFSTLGILSDSVCKPFSKHRKGMNVAEGFAMLLLQSERTSNSVEMCGVGYSSDAFHMTQPNPAGAIKAMQNTLTCKGLEPQDIDYINAHGTGTLANDTSEIEAIGSLFGKDVPISSTKSITGHTLGAAGAIEAIICVMAIQNQMLLPNWNLDEPEVLEMNYIIKPQEKKIRYALSNSFAFGGNNTSLLFGLVK